MTRHLLVWIGGALEASAVVAVLGALLADHPAAEPVLVTLAAILLLNGVALQLFSTGMRELGER